MRIAFGAAWLMFATAAACGSDDVAPLDVDVDAGQAAGDSGAAPDAPSASIDSGGRDGGVVVDSSVVDSGNFDGGGVDGGGVDGGVDADFDADFDAGPVVTTTYATSMSANFDTACVITPANGLKCWGGVTAPAAVGVGSTWKYVSVGATTLTPYCAIRSDNTLWCWSNGRNLAPSQPRTGSFQSVSAANGNQCAIASTGALYCWGGNAFGQLGVGDTAFRAAPTQVGTALDWKVVALGGSHACAIKTSGALHCWGWNAFGAVGDGAGGGNDRSVPVPVDATKTYLDVDTKNTASCGIRSDGILHCWGAGLTTGTKLTPMAVDSATDWAKVRLGAAHACALKKSGTLYCWGANDRGQLGIPVAAGNLSRATPQQVGLDANWVDFAVGEGFTCATKPDGAVRCWGANGRGQLAQSPSVHTTPTRVGAASEFAFATAGPNNVCAVRKNGELACWGLAGGVPAVGVASQTPTTIGAATDWKTAKPGYSGACATKTNDSLHCWASGASPAPVNLTVSAYDVGYFHQCAIASSSLYCWGDGIFGKLGNGTNAGLTTPTKVGTDTWKAVATSFDATCGLKADGTLWCFGFQFTVIEKQGASTAWSVVEASPQAQQFYGLQGGSLYRWDFGAVPAASGAENDWTSIATSSQHACGIRANGTLWCKGYNPYGQLGNGTLVDSPKTLVQVGTANDWTSVTAGTYATCGLRGSGDLYCWGSNDYGEAGDGTSWTSSPVVVP